MAGRVHHDAGPSADAADAGDRVESGDAGVEVLEQRGEFEGGGVGREV